MTNMDMKDESEGVKNYLDRYMYITLGVEK